MHFLKRKFYLYVDDNTTCVNVATVSVEQVDKCGLAERSMNILTVRAHACYTRPKILAAVVSHEPRKRSGLLLRVKIVT